MNMKVKDICNLQNGRAFKPDDWGTKGLPIIRIQNLNDEDAPFNYYAGEYSPAHEVNDGELLFSWSGTPGTSFGAFRWYRGKGVLNQHIFRVIPKIDVDKEYLKYALNGNISIIISKAHGGVGLQHITKKELDEIEIPIVPVQKQKDIIAVLQRVERLIAFRKNELQQLEDLIKARFVEMFGNPIINDRAWKQITLLESLEEGRTVSYGIVQTGDDYENGVPVFRPVDIAGGHVPKRYELKKTAPAISAQYKRTLLKGNELLITVRGSVGETFQTTEEFAGCNVGRNIVPLLTNHEKIEQRFLQELFVNDAIKGWLKSITKGIALQGLNMSEFKEMPVIMPPIYMQRDFVAIANQVDKSKVAMQAALDKTQLLFDSLMQKYFG